MYLVLILCLLFLFLTFKNSNDERDVGDTECSLILAEKFFIGYGYLSPPLKSSLSNQEQQNAICSFQQYS